MERQKNASRKKYHILYRTTCIITDRHYTGMHSTDDLNDGYLGSGMILRWSVKKHGKENHIREVLEFCSNRKILREREKEVVNESLLRNPLCMNLSKGGGFDITSMEKMSLSAKRRKRKPHSEETRRKIGDAHRGKTISDEQKSIISRVHKGKIPWNKGLTKESDERVAQGAGQLSRVKKGRTKETHAYITHHAEMLRGRTKENHPSVARMAEKRRVPWSFARRQAYERLCNR